MPGSRLLSAAAILLAGPALAEVPRVVTDIAPVHALAAGVMGELGTPDLLIEPGQSPHGHVLRPSEARALDQADVVFWVGPELTPQLGETVAALTEGARSLALIDAEGVTRLPFREGPVFAAEGAAHSGGHGHDTAEEHHAEEHGQHNHDGIDPHAWLDPRNAKAWVGRMAETLSEADPEHAATYRQNAEATVGRIETLTEEVAARLEGVSPGSFVVFHDAYQYFETGFDLSSAGAISLADASDPSPARLAELREAMAGAGVRCVLTEPQFNAGLAQSVLGNEIDTAVVDPIGTGLEPGAALYEDLLRRIAGTLADCAG